MKLSLRRTGLPHQSSSRQYLAAGFLLFFLLFPISRTTAQDITIDENKSDSKAQWMILPYAFRSETWETAFGIGGVVSEWPAESATTYGAVTFSTNKSWNIVAGGVGYPGLISDRLFIEPFASFNEYTNLQVYVPGNPAYLSSPNKAGSNDSNPNNFFRESSQEVWLQAQFRYILPLGSGAEDPIHTYYIDRGMLASGASGGSVWNPLESGRTSILLRPYYRTQDVVIPVTDNPFSFDTLNVQLGLEYDNRDFRTNPSKGSYQKIAITRDWGALGDSYAWTFGEIELAKYLDLGSNSLFRQQVIGLNAWTGYSFTWEEVDVPGLNFPVAVNHPPYFTGATLGGLMRMRGYPQARFNDRAVSYYSAEYRVIPHWTPFSFYDIDKMLDLDWWQISLFVEAGRVSDTYNMDLFYKDLHYDTGVDLRFFLHNSVVRIGFAVSDESYQVVAMFGQPF